MGLLRVPCMFGFNCRNIDMLILLFVRSYPHVLKTVLRLKHTVKTR